MKVNEGFLFLGSGFWFLVLVLVFEKAEKKTFKSLDIINNGIRILPIWYSGI